MKAIVLTLLSCVLLGGVYGILSFTTKTTNNVVALPDQDGANKAKAETASNSPSHTADTSKTLNDSHWLDDAEFQKAVEADLLSDNQADNENKAEKAAPEKAPNAPKLKKEDPAAEQAAPGVRQLILELAPDTTAPAKKSVPVEVV